MTLTQHRRCRALSKSKLKSEQEMREISKSEPISGELFENLDEWLTHAEACTYLRISTGALRNMVWRAEIRCYKLGSRSRYNKSELRNLLKQSDKKGFQ